MGGSAFRDNTMATQSHPGLNSAQYKILEGAILVSEKKMGDSMQSWANVNYTLDFDTIIDQGELDALRKDMYSRKPIVLDRNDP